MSETIQATVVVSGQNGVLIRGESGSGKSFLALSLIRNGGWLVGDDRVHVSVVHDRLLASVPAAIEGLMELRGRGLIAVPCERSAVVRLVVDIVAEEALDRMPDESQLVTTVLGVELPRQPVPRRSKAAIPLVEAALAALSPPAVMGLRTIGVWG